MRKLEWDDIGVKVDGRQLHHLRFADDILLITSTISQAERMLTEFDETCGRIGLQLNLQKVMFIRNGWVLNAPFTLSGTNIFECTSYVLNMMNDLTPELGRGRRAAWGAYKSIEDVVKKTKNTRLRAHLFNATVPPALTYSSNTWAFRKQEENAVSVIERAIERVMLGVSRFTQVRKGIRSSLLRQRSKIRDAAAFAKESKIRWAGHLMRFNENRWTRAVSDWVPCDIKRTTGRPPTRWSDFFTKSFKEKYDVLRAPREKRNHWATLARSGQMEELLAPARPVRRSTGVEVMEVNVEVSPSSDPEKSKRSSQALRHPTESIMHTQSTADWLVFISFAGM
ncbi:hypothetical protein RB195_025540 [Necator americanus]